MTTNNRIYVNVISAILGGLVLNVIWSFVQPMFEKPNNQLVQVESSIQEINNKKNEVVTNINNITQNITKESSLPKDLGMRLADEIEELNNLSSQLSSESEKSLKLAKIFRDRQTPPDNVTEEWARINSSIYLKNDGNAAVNRDYHNDGSLVNLTINGVIANRKVPGYSFDYEEQGKKARITYKGMDNGLYGFSCQFLE